MIGRDNTWAMEYLDQLKPQNPEDPMAVKTSLGWALMGPKLRVSRLNLSHEILKLSEKSEIHAANAQHDKNWEPQQNDAPPAVQNASSETPGTGILETPPKQVPYWKPPHYGVFTIVDGKKTYTRRRTREATNASKRQKLQMSGQNNTNKDSTGVYQVQSSCSEQEIEEVYTWLDNGKVHYEERIINK